MTNIREVRTVYNWVISWFISYSPVLFWCEAFQILGQLRAEPKHLITIHRQPKSGIILFNRLSWMNYHLGCLVFLNMLDALMYLQYLEGIPI